MSEPESVNALRSLSRRARQSAIALMICVAALPVWSSVRACQPLSSEANRGDAQNIEEADAVFLAHITRLDELPRTSTSPAMAKATYRLLTSFKGDIPSVGSVRTSLSNCHATLLPGGDYLVFARRDVKTGDLIVAPGFRGTRQFFKGVDESEGYARAIRNSVPKSSNPHP